MKKFSTTFLQIVIIMLGLGVAAFMLWEPHLEGRNVDATTFEIYFKDPFLAYVYIASIPFFTALYQAFKLLSLAGKNQIFSPAAVNGIRIIKYCSMITAGAIIVAEIYIRIVATPNDDPAGAIMLGIILTFICVVIATAATLLEKVLQNSVDIKSENDLTV